ncbi:hypothetical protein [Ramlibacter sp. AN1133]|uniref:hypothetical protein n=1 Tax=Ramlibacter sp. AN1133 TaxID=3133429 RepID=UPI0030BB272D
MFNPGILVERILELLSLTLAAAAGAACIGGATAFVWKRRQDDDTSRDILRLAAEIDGVAAGIETDLEGAADDPPCVVFRQRSREARERALQALAQGKALKLQEREALITTLLLLHDDHRRVVDLRSDVDRALARKAQAAGEDRSRVINFGRTRPSCWPTSSLLTRPSTFG